MCTCIAGQFRRAKLDDSQRSVKLHSYTPHVVLRRVEIVEFLMQWHACVVKKKKIFAPIRSACHESKSCAIGHRCNEGQSDRFLRGVWSRKSGFPSKVRHNHAHRVCSPGGGGRGRCLHGAIACFVGRFTPILIMDFSETNLIPTIWTIFY